MSSESCGPAWLRRLSVAGGQVEVREGLLQTAQGRCVALVAASDEALVSIAAQADGYVGWLRPVGSGDLLGRGELAVVVEQAVGQIEALVRGHDAYDVMAMLCQYLIPPDLALWSESGSSVAQSWAAAEVVALVLLGRGLPGRDPGMRERTAAIVPELVAAGAAVVRLATVHGMSRYGRLAAEGVVSAEWAAMAFRLSSHETSVRGRQYSVVAERINDVVLRTPQAARVLRSVLGFGYDDVLAVRGALVELVGEAHERVLAVLDAVARSEEVEDAPVRAALEALLETPSQLQQVSARQVADCAGLGQDTAAAVLDRFSVRPDERTALELVMAFVDGRNPMAGLAMLSAAGREYLPLPGAMGVDEVRRTCEAPIKGTRAWTKYGRARDMAVEGLVADTLSEMLDGRATVHRNLSYRADGAAHDLSASSTTHASAPLTEADCLLVLDGVAICVEVKAGDLRARTRQGGVTQLQGDLDKTVRSAAGQADRLRDLVTEHRGVWRQDGTWLDLADVREIHCLVVCLDDLGPLALSMADLVGAGVLTQTHLPWVVSVHDLLVTRHVLDRPEHVLGYLRRRTSRDPAMWVSGSDELDLLMWYVAGGFHFVPDPDRLHAKYPASKPPTAQERSQYAAQGPTVVGTLTDPLDAYYYGLDGSSSRHAPCPRRGALPPLLDGLIEAMREQASPGWWRTGADLDAFSTQAQEQLATYISDLVRTSRRDGQFHTFTTGSTDDTGRWIHIYASGPDTPRTRDHLQRYLTAKKHQQQADRALAVHLNTDGSPRHTLWLDHPPENDPDLDRLARAMRLVPADRAPRSIPPKAKRQRKHPRST